uniref:Diaminopimelate epimerase n=1 Tax=uncultured bacterium contig00010 TaxID=1181502 RepID=A0A806KFN2_9BACT|nr:carbamoyl-phosphate synthase, large subunit [uncultured bacterium contig00010]
MLYENELYVIEVNPRASRTVPYISKVTGVPMCELATKVSVGQTLASLGYKSGIARIPPYIAVKVPVFSFEKLAGLDTHLGPEMKSTGEVLGLGKNLEEALYKGLVAAGYKMNKKGGVLITLRDGDKPEIIGIVQKFIKLGFTLHATRGTARFIAAKGFPVEPIDKICDNPEANTETLLASGKISYIISTSERGRDPLKDDVKLRRKACSLGVPCLTSIDTANALADSLLSDYSEINTELVDINNLRNSRMKLPFTKMHGCSNDFIIINCFDIEINSPESLSVLLSDRHTGIGSEGIVLLLRSERADAKIRIFDLDGSEDTIGGNAIRCAAKYLFDNDIVSKRHMKIETKVGIKELDLATRDGKVLSVKVNMGYAELRPESIPVNLIGDKIVAHPVTIGGKEYKITCVSLGNPHAVVFCDGVDKLDMGKIGPLFENDPLFPERVNVEFAEVMSRTHLKLHVWERGTGETQACGTGACTSVVAAVLNGHCDLNTDIKVQLPGGDLIINYDGKTLYMTGDCVKIYDGVVEI